MYAPIQYWEQWQWRGTLQSSKLRHYWSFPIKLFTVMSRTFAVGILPLCKDALSVFYCSSRLGYCLKESIDILLIKMILKTAFNFSYIQMIYIRRITVAVNMLDCSIIICKFWTPTVFIFGKGMNFFFPSYGLNRFNAISNVLAYFCRACSLSLSLYIYIYIYTHTHIYIYVCVCVCVCVCVIIIYIW